MFQKVANTGNIGKTTILMFQKVANTGNIGKTTIDYLLMVLFL